MRMAVLHGFSSSCISLTPSRIFRQIFSFTNTRLLGRVPAPFLVLRSPTLFRLFSAVCRLLVWSLASMICSTIYPPTNYDYVSLGFETRLHLPQTSLVGSLAIFLIFPTVPNLAEKTTIFCLTLHPCSSLENPSPSQAHI